MAVTQSSFSINGPVQPDGSRTIVETHTLSGGGAITFSYQAPGSFDPASTLAARATAINTTLAQDEVTANMLRDGVPTTSEQSMTAFLNAMRAAYRSSDRTDTCRIAWWLLRRIAAGHITDAQCRTAFGGLTTTQWNNFKTNTLTPQSNAWAAVIAATGS